MQGALAGRYRVTVSKKLVVSDPDEILYSEGKITYDELQSRMARKGESDAKVYDSIPARYGAADTSGLTAEVKAKTDNVCDFTLTSK